MEARRKWHNIFQVIKENNSQSRVYTKWKYPTGMKEKL